MSKNRTSLHSQLLYDYIQTILYSLVPLQHFTQLYQGYSDLPAMHLSLSCIYLWALDGSQPNGCPLLAAES